MKLYYIGSSVHGSFVTAVCFVPSGFLCLARGHLEYSIMISQALFFS